MDHHLDTGLEDRNQVCQGIDTPRFRVGAMVGQFRMRD
jgi:hypothetical protein